MYSYEGIIECVLVNIPHAFIKKGLYTNLFSVLTLNSWVPGIANVGIARVGDLDLAGSGGGVS